MTYRAVISDYYGKLLNEHGVGAAAIDGTNAGQRLRFDVIASMAGKWEFEHVLDVGCGYGAFLDYLNQEGCAYSSYTGIDLTPGMISAAQDRHVNGNFHCQDIGALPFQHRFDTVVASGIFQLKQDPGYIHRIIKAMWERTGRVCVFNMLSHNAENQLPNEEYCNPRSIELICEQYTPFTDRRGSYRKNDFTIAMFREQQDA